jgi:hypothetical protein
MAVGADDTNRTEDLYNRIIALSDNVLTSCMERDRPTETATKLLEVELCRLLGFCGLGWGERHLTTKSNLRSLQSWQRQRHPYGTIAANQALFDDIIVCKKRHGTLMFYSIYVFHQSWILSVFTP